MTGASVATKKRIDGSMLMFLEMSWGMLLFYIKILSLSSMGSAMDFLAFFLLPMMIRIWAFSRGVLSGTQYGFKEAFDFWSSFIFLVF